MGIKIVTDSTAYLEDKVCQLLDITVVSLSVNFENESYKELDITNEEFYYKMDKSPKIPTSSQPSPADFYEAFVRIVREGHGVLGIFISSELSGTYFSAVTGRGMVLEEFPEARIELLDSRSAAPQMGYAVLTAARAAQAGAGMEETICQVQNNFNKSRMYFTPKTLDYLKKGGRIGEAAAILGALLQVKPILTLVDGKVTVFDKVRTSEKAIQRIISVFEHDFTKHGVPEVTILHINCFDEARKVADNLQDKYGITVDVATMGPVIGLHVGPGTMGMAYYTEE